MRLETVFTGKRLLPTTLAAVLLASPPAQALTDGADLQKWCTGQSVAASGRCFGYLLAVEDALAGGPLDGVRACLPRDIGLSEQHQLLLEWLKANPGVEAATALELVVRAYASRYPCP